MFLEDQAKWSVKGNPKAQKDFKKWDGDWECKFCILSKFDVNIDWFECVNCQKCKHTKCNLYTDSDLVRMEAESQSNSISEVQCR